MSDQTNESAANTPDTVIYGASVKALGNGRVGGYLVLFSTAKDPDTSGEFFAPDTDFGSHVTTPVFYQHGMDTKIGARILASKATLARDEVGVWIEAQLEMRDGYEKAIYALAEKGKLGWSSGTASHLVQRRPEGKAQRITTWPLGLDASLTPTPVEPRTFAVPLKSLQVSVLELQAAEAGDAMPRQEPDTINQINRKTEATKMAEVNTVPAQSAPAADNGAAIAALTEQVTALAAMMKALVTPADKSGGAGYAVSDPASVRVIDRSAPFKSLGDFAQAVASEATKSLSEETYNRLSTHQKAMVKATGMSENVASDGGFLVGSDISNKWMERMYMTGQILSRVSRDPVGPNANGATYRGVAETSRANGSRFGGVLSYWMAEAGSVTKSAPSFRQLDLKLNKVAALAYATSEQLQDSTNLEAMLNRVVPQELIFRTEDAIINGDGVGKPRGILVSSALVSQAAEGGQTATTFNTANATKMWGRCFAGVRQGAVWLINQDVENQLYQLTLGNYPIYLPPGGIQNAQLGALMGRPVVPVEYCASLGTVGDVILANLAEYQLIDKGSPTAASSIHVQFLTDEVAFRFTYRVDGAPSWHSALTPFKGSNTQSAFVAVAAR